jgi:hypothetical protein
MKSEAERARDYKTRLSKDGYKKTSLIVHESELEKLEAFKKKLKHYRRG